MNRSISLRIHIFFAYIVDTAIYIQSIWKKEIKSQFKQSDLRICHLFYCNPVSFSDYNWFVDSDNNISSDWVLKKE